jgi:hypothetical protein
VARAELVEEADRMLLASRQVAVVAVEHGQAGAYVAEEALRSPRLRATGCTARRSRPARCRTPSDCSSRALRRRR